MEEATEMVQVGNAVSWTYGCLYNCAGCAQAKSAKHSSASSFFRESVLFMIQNSILFNPSVNLSCT